MQGITDHTQHQINHHDQLLKRAVEEHSLQLAEFTHRSHLSLAYVYLVEQGFDQGYHSMTETLRLFLKAKGVDPAKFHVTLTWAWMKAVWHFMQQSEPMSSAGEFLAANPVLLNKDVLLSHYSHDWLFSERARTKRVRPDLNPFPDN